MTYYRKRERWATYKDFLNSCVWKYKRQYVRDRDKCCKKCASYDNLQVHHKTYQYGWDCDVYYLELLCDDCHYNQHHPTLTLEELHKKIENWNPYE